MKHYIISDTYKVMNCDKWTKNVVQSVQCT